MCRFPSSRSRRRSGPSGATTLGRTTPGSCMLWAGHLHLVHDHVGVRSGLPERSNARQGRAFRGVSYGPLVRACAAPARRQQRAQAHRARAAFKRPRGRVSRVSQQGSAGAGAGAAERLAVLAGELGRVLPRDLHCLRHVVEGGQRLRTVKRPAVPGVFRWAVTDYAATAKPLLRVPSRRQPTDGSTLHDTSRSPCRRTCPRSQGTSLWTNSGSAFRWLEWRGSSGAARS